MSPFQIYIALNRELGNNNYPKEITTADMTYWINKAIEQIVDDTYLDGPDKTEYNKQILKGLYRNNSFTPIEVTPADFNNSVEVDLVNEPIRYVLNESVDINYDNFVFNEDITETTLDTYNIHLRDPFSEHRIHFNHARPLRMFVDNRAILIHDGNYTIPSYRINYITNPTLFNFSSPSDTDEYEDLPAKIHKKIITKAARMALENEGNQRYKSYLLEDNKEN